jgi:type I restriction enzyme S subunit
MSHQPKLSDWPRRTIAECASNEPYSTQIGPFGKALTPEEYTPSGVPLLRGGNVNHGRFFDDGFVFISEETADRMAKFESFPDDVLLVHKGTLGKIGLMPKARKYNRYIMGNSMLRVRCNRSMLLPEYLYYWLCSAEGQHYIFSRVSQVGVPQIQTPLKTLREASLPVPPIHEQESIISVLTTFDEKLESNERINETLEIMARTLFRGWFVDFDPVHAKAAVRRQRPSWTNAQVSSAALPKLAPDIAEIFPDRFEDSTLGPIPAGWKVGTVGEIGDNPRRGLQPSEIQDGTPYIALEHMPRRSIALSEWDVADSVASGKFAFHSGEILFGKLRPYFHKVGVPAIDGVCSTDVLVIAPQTEDWFGVLLGHTSSDEMIAHVDMASTGTKMPRTNWGDIARFGITVPSVPIARVFAAQARGIIATIHANIHESHYLAATRDALLPKLLSGELT